MKTVSYPNEEAYGEKPKEEKQKEQDEEEQGGSAFKKEEGLTLAEKMGLWNTSQQKLAGEQSLERCEIEEDETDDYAIAHFPHAWKFLTESQAYKWLLGRMKSETLLTERKGTIAENIADEILSGLNSMKMDYSYTKGIRKAFFEISWPLSAFVKEHYPGEEQLQLGSIITITGSGIDAQALTCSEYMCQVWPTTGLETLAVVQEAMAKGPGKSHKCKTI
jgi:hypothetical protein